MSPRPTDALRAHAADGRRGGPGCLAPDRVAGAQRHAGRAAETHDRVMAAVEELKYRRNFAAKQLASTRSRTRRRGDLGEQPVRAGQRAARAGGGGPADGVPAGHRQRRVDVDARRSATAVDQLLEQAVEALVVIVPHESVLREAHSLGLDIPVVVVEGDLSRDPADRRRRQRPGRSARDRAPAVAGARDRRAPLRPDGLGRVARAPRRLAR